MGQITMAASLRGTSAALGLPTYEAGVEEGEKRGKREGKIEGKLESKKEIAKKFKAKGLSIKEIAEMTELLEEEIEKL
jgi:predicted transposase/invertase (TIGR01784 family)